MLITLCSGYLPTRDKTEASPLPPSSRGMEVCTHPPTFFFFFLWVEADPSVLASAPDVAFLLFFFFLSFAAFFSGRDKRTGVHVKGDWVRAALGVRHC